MRYASRVSVRVRTVSRRFPCSHEAPGGRGSLAARQFLALSIQGGEGAVKRYCISCDDERHLREERRSQSCVVRGEVVEFEAPVLVWAACGEVVFDPGGGGSSSAPCATNSRRRGSREAILHQL